MNKLDDFSKSVVVGLLVLVLYTSIAFMFGECVSPFSVEGSESGPTGWEWYSGR